NIYSTFSSLTAAVRGLRPTVEIGSVPGIMAFQALAARAGAVLLDGTESLSLVTALDGPEALDAAIEDPTRAVVVYKGGRHVPEALLTHARPDAVVHDSAAMTLEDVLGVYAAHPTESVVRLHSGDPALYGAIQEQIDWCVDNGRNFEIVPGVSSLAAAAAAAGRELTVPALAQSVVMTRLAGRTAASMPARETVAAFAAHGAAMAVFLSGARPRQLQEELLGPGSVHGRDTP